MVDMVNNQMVRGGHYHSMHYHPFSPPIGSCVRGIDSTRGMPFVFDQLVVVFGIDEGEFAFGRGILRTVSEPAL